MIIATLAEKGGVGKTMLATNLAGMRASAGRRVMIVDGDRQGAAHAWTRERTAGRLPPVNCEARYGNAFSIYVTGPLRTRPYDDVIIDLGQGDSEEMDAALEVTDCALVPVRPTAVDMRTIGLIDVRVEEAQEVNPALRGLAVLNQVSPNPRHRAVQDAKTALDAGCVALDVATVAVCDRVGFQRAYALGRTIDEYPEAGEKAAAEIAAVYELVFGEPYNGNAEPLTVAEARR